MEKTARRIREHPAVVLAAGAMLVSGGLLLHWLSRLTFWRDEWDFLLHRRGWSVSTFLDPAVEHLSTIPILLYKLQLEVFGMESPAPFQVVAVLGFLASVALLFVYVRLRVGRVARAGSDPPDPLPRARPGTTCSSRTRSTSSVPSPAGSARCSVSSAGRRWDVAATGLLVASAALLRRRNSVRRRGRASRSPGPGALAARLRAARSDRLWVIWYLGWGHTADTFVSLHNLGERAELRPRRGELEPGHLARPQRPPPSPSAPSSLDWGRPLLVLARRWSLLAVCSGSATPASCWWRSRSCSASGP